MPVKLDDEKCETFAELTAAVVKHMEDFPAHGRTCVCLDGLVRSVRRGLGLPSIHVRPEGYEGGYMQWIHDVVELETRVNYILRLAGRTH